MADNAISVAGSPVSSKDRSGVQWQRMLDGNALSAAVLVASVTTSSGSAAFAADASTRRQMVIKNTGTVTAEISPTISFAMGNGLPLAVGESMSTNYSGAIYARVASGTGELRAWSED